MPEQLEHQESLDLSNGGPSEQVLQEAQKFGWVPKEEYRGDPEAWVGAEEFVQRGKTIMPILRKNNERLLAEVQGNNNRIQQLEQTIKANMDTMEALKESAVENAKLAAKRAAAEARAQIREARENGDVDAEEDAREQLRRAQHALDNPPKVVDPPPTPPVVDPVLQAWSSRNTWFGRDQQRTIRAQAVAAYIKTDPSTQHLQGQAFLDELDKRLDPTVPSKVVGGGAGQGGGSGGSVGKTYETLPQEAKDTCIRQAARLVGEGRAFKDLQSWQKEYAKIYYTEE